MKMKLITALAFLSGIMLAPFAAATIYEGTDSERIETGEYYEHYFTGLQAGDKIEITVEVTTGGNIDVMMMDTINFAKFKSALQTGEGGWNNINSEKNTRLVTINTVAPSDGDYVLVIDNTNQPSGGADSGDYVDVSLIYKTYRAEEEDVGGTCGGAIILPILAVGAIFMQLYVRSRKQNK